MAEFAEELRKRIHEKGPLSFRDYMEEVLSFYYSLPRNPIGMDGDFYTSADLDPVFGKLLATQFAQWARDFDNFTLIELGAGKGLLARDILQHRRFPYMILERSSAMRRRQEELLRDYDVKWIEELPRGVTGCVFSNEFFDALPVHRVVRRNGVLKEIFVTEDLGEIECDSGSWDLPIAEGQLTEVNLESPGWIRRISACLDRGYHVAIDYGYLHDEYYAQPRGTLMCYWRHQAVEDPYIRAGEQDMTAHVNFSDLIEEGNRVSLPTVGIETQKDFLIRLGILDEIERLAVAGDAESMRRLIKIKKLILPGSMGERFKVLVQTKRTRV